MRYTVNEVKEFIDQEDVKFIRLAFIDLKGKLKNISITPVEIERAFSDGISFDGSSIPNFSTGFTNELVLKPIASTFHVLPWRPSSGKVVRMFCNIEYPDGTVYEMDTRKILENAVAEAKELGLTVEMGSEMEFYLFKTYENGEPTDEPFDNAGYMDVAPEDKGENIRREICFTLLDMGITPESSMHMEGPGQNQIVFRYAKALKAADNAVNFVSVVKAAAQHNGLYANFSPKPIPDKPGSGLHINISVTGNDDTQYNPAFMAGIMKHIREITVFLNTTEESYKRFGEHSAPKYVSWSKGNRSQLLRVPQVRNEHGRFELRSPDPMLNPYLAFAMLIYAGLDGVKNNLTLPEQVNINFNADGAIVPDGMERLPLSYEEAVELARNSEFVKQYVGESVLKAL